MTRYLTPLQFRWAMTGLTAALLLLALGWTLASAPVAFDIQPYSSERCAINNGNQPQSLTVLASPIVAKALLPVLCRSQVLAAHYQQVELHWPALSELQADDLILGKYALVWARPETLKAVLHNFEAYYTELWANPNYRVFWISQSAIPRWNATFVRQQHIGLLADRNSYSGYQLPLASLQLPDLSLSELTIRFYADRQALTDAFARGEISLYPAVLLNKQGVALSDTDPPPYYDVSGQPLPMAHLHPMSGTSNGGSFYLHNSLAPLNCELAGLLKESRLWHGVIKVPCP
ncbi:hypothetical protein [Rheinheimera sp.]|uniref:hypothetical protein n=1 Tax=Rheinheimera sp. TaxID=1869214 RepID=UPI00307D580E